MNIETSFNGIPLSGKTKKTIYWASFFSLASIAGLSFWLFSRFTVDDAFISWRYGKNLVESGVWGYNPVSFDLTQAYTNFIYAFLSIIPNYLGIDVVLFFKMISLLIITSFGIWYARKTSLWLCVLFLYAVPATFIHAFSGLETFLFVCLVAMLFIFLLEDKFWRSVICVLILFMTRPESWVFIGLVPLFFLLPRSLDTINVIKEPKSLINNAINFNDYNLKSALWAIAVLAIPMVLYFYLHESHFGYALPNTFYIKSGSIISLQDFFYLGFMATPVIGLLAANKNRTFLVASLFFGVVVAYYSTSNLTMNYIDRFAYHVIAPSYLILVYVAANYLNGKFYVSSSDTTDKKYIPSYRSIALIIAILWMSIFGIQNLSVSKLAHVANYYPRILDAHADLGNAISEDSRNHDIDAMSFGDAGMTSYHAELASLDNIGLGSATVTHDGINEALELYNPEIIIFHATPESIRYKSHHQQEIYDWALERNYDPVCQVYTKPDYTSNIYSKYNLDNVERVCDSSKKVNNMWDKEKFLKQGINAPWLFWRE